MSMENLKYFFQSYFHLDWRKDYECSLSVVQDFVDHETFETRVQLKNDLEELLNSGEVSNEFIWELGGCFRPSSEGKTANIWLLEVIQLLE